MAFHAESHRHAAHKKRRRDDKLLCGVPNPKIRSKPLKCLGSLKRSTVMGDPKSYSLRTRLSVVILFMGIGAGLLVLLSGQLYISLTHESHERTTRQLLEVKYRELLDKLHENVSSLALSLQRDGALKTATANSELEQVELYLTSQFRQYFTTASILDLKSLSLLDLNYDVLVTATAERQEPGRDLAKTAVCPSIRVEATQRTGAERLKSYGRLCADRGATVYSLIAPVGTLRPVGYIQVNVNPTPAMVPIETSLSVPLKIVNPDGSIAYQSKTWPAKPFVNGTASVDHVVSGTPLPAAMRIEVIHEMPEFTEKVSRANRIMAGLSTLIVVPTILFALFVTNRSLRPLKDLRLATERMVRGEQAQIIQRSCTELDQPIRSFNSMSQDISNLIGALKGEIEQRRRAEAELVLHRDSLETLVRERTRELEAARDAALAASRAKSRFLANMSHELRTPLNAIIGYNEMLSGDAEQRKDESAVQDHRRIARAAKHLLEIVGAVLDLSKVEAGKMAVHADEIAIAGLVGDVADAARYLVEEGRNRLEIVCGDNVGHMVGDATKIRQILFNLLGNAAKFTRDGTITLEIKSPLASGNWIQFIVRDSGIGIEPSVIEKIFLEFTQADDSSTRIYGGTGLGLAICRRFCEMMGGWIVVCSDPGKGTAFEFMLPRTPYARGTASNTMIADVESNRALAAAAPIDNGNTVE